MKILNLYAGIGGNRRLWKGHEVTSVEYDENIAKVYASLYPNDNVIVGDAHEYLLKHFDEYDFIWTSPPCQSHSSFRQNICVRYRGTEPVYPDMKLYQEILFLQANSKKRWIAENVKPYYSALIKPTQVLQRHYLWSNFDIAPTTFEKTNLRSEQIPDLQKRHGVDLTGVKLPNKRQVLRNCVDGELGSYILKQLGD